MLRRLAADTKRRTGSWMVCLLVPFVLVFSSPCFADEQPGTPPAQTQVDAQTIAQQVASLIEKGRWEEADALLDLQDLAGHASLAQLRRILDEQAAQETKRADRQQQLFSESHAALTAALSRLAAHDPNMPPQEALKQVQTVWKDATETQKKDLSAQPAFMQLMDQARENAQTYYAKGQWSDAYTHGVRWLEAFDAENPACRDWEAKLSEVNAILEFVKNTPCEDKQQRYASIERDTVRQVFSILQANYVKPLDFNKMATGMLKRGAVLADVLKTAPADLVIEADPNEVTRWAEHIQQCLNDAAQQPATLDLQGLEELQDALLALNEKTMKVPEGFLLAMMTEAALAELDPYTDVVWPYAVDNFDKAMTGQFGGVGILIRKENDGFLVTSLIPDTPAMKAGVRADALILAVDGESTKDMSASCAVQKISGPVGTSVTLTIRYPDAETEQLLTMTRDKIVLPAVEGSRQADTGNEGRWDYFLDEADHIGYLSLKNFTDQTVPQVKAALAKMESKGLAGLIVDIRGNGGGLLTAAVEVSDLFVDGSVLLKSKGRDDRFNEWAATDDSAGRMYPLAILIDGASASASEIVAGVLGSSSTKRAVLIGTRSYGKGSVQEIVSLGSDKGKLKYTSAYYYLPDGSPVKNRETASADGGKDWGIAPDITVPLYDFERQQMQEVNAKRTRISNETNPAEAEGETESQTPLREQLLAADPQLATALLVVKAQIAVSGKAGEK